MLSTVERTLLSLSSFRLSGGSGCRLYSNCAGGGGGGVSLAIKNNCELAALSPPKNSFNGYSTTHRSYSRNQYQERPQRQRRDSQSFSSEDGGGRGGGRRGGGFHGRQMGGRQAQNGVGGDDGGYDRRQGYPHRGMRRQGGSGGRGGNSRNYNSGENAGEEGGNEGSRESWRDRSVIPVRISNRDRRRVDMNRELEMVRMNVTEYKQKFRREIKEYGDPLTEADPNDFAKTFDDYLEESDKLRDWVKVKKLTSKHYKEMNPWKKELNLLTWAEKETIRYLHQSDPEEWTPEALSRAFPISEVGVSRLVKSSLRLRRVKDVEQHDQTIVDRLKMIEKGEIEMTEELEKRLKVRKVVPLKPGDLGLNPNAFVDMGLPEKLGKFASLVAPQERKKKKEDEGKGGKEKVVKLLAEGELFTEEKGGEGLKPQLTMEELKKILPVRKTMTFREFETLMKKEDAGSLAGDMKYMLEEVGRGPKSEGVTAEMFEREEKGAEVMERVQKYRQPGEEEGQMVEVKLEGDQAYLYREQTGYQKPYEPAVSVDPFKNVAGFDNASPPERIEIPEEMKGKPGATYKIGDCYYDEDGEFLYKVV